MREARWTSTRTHRHVKPHSLLLLTQQSTLNSRVAQTKQRLSENVRRTCSCLKIAIQKWTSLHQKPPFWVNSRVKSKSGAGRRWDRTMHCTGLISVFSQCELVSGWKLQKQRSAPPCEKNFTLVWPQLKKKKKKSSSIDAPQIWRSPTCCCNPTHSDNVGDVGTTETTSQDCQPCQNLHQNSCHYTMKQHITRPVTFSGNITQHTMSQTVY